AVAGGGDVHTGGLVDQHGGSAIEVGEAHGDSPVVDQVGVRALGRGSGQPVGPLACGLEEVVPGGVYARPQLREVDPHELPVPLADRPLDQDRVDVGGVCAGHDGRARVDDR